MVYTDGACTKNGKVGARGGIGVYFGPDDPRNLSEPLRHERQTNQLAEVMAAVRALETAPRDIPLHIITDSEYVQKGITVITHFFRFFFF